MESGRSQKCERWKEVLHASSIEAPATEFVIEFVKFGSERRRARRCQVRVLAETERGALKICRSRVRHAERFTIVSTQGKQPQGAGLARANS